MSWFAGTSTGRQYTVGATYSMGGQTYTANRDGSFTSQQTGRTLVGSSQSPNVARSGGTSIAGDDVRAAAERGLAQELARRNGVAVTAGPGARLVASRPGAGPGPVPNAAPSQNAGVGPGAPGAIRAQNVAEARRRASEFSNLTLSDLPPRKFPKSEQQMYIGTYALPHVNVSDGGVAEERYGDFGGAIWGMGVLAVDGYVTAVDVGVKASQAAGFDPAAAAVDFARYLDERKAAVPKQSGDWLGQVLGDGDIPEAEWGRYYGR